LPIATRSGVDLAYRIDGDGRQTVVLVAGLVDPKEAWVGQVPALAERYRVLTLDNRGVGESSPDAGPYSIADLADDLAAVVDHAGLDRFHLVGNSMGGMIAQEYAIARPARLLSAAFCVSYAHAGAYGSRLLASFREAVPALGVGFAQRQALLWAFTPDYVIDREDELVQVEQIIAANPPRAETYLAQLDASGRHDTRGRLDAIACPALTLVGEHDLLVPARLSRELHDELPRSTWVEVPGGHACFWERPAEFNAAVLNFLAGV
jgi:3-oxoadipate enol-lactonase